MSDDPSASAGDRRRAIPSVDKLLASTGFAALLERHPRGRVVDALRAAIAEVRAGTQIHGNDETDVTTAYAREVERRLDVGEVRSLRAVINATGVVLHTNLGRAPLADVAVEAMQTAARDYTNLEYDLEAGERGSRYDHCAALLSELTGAPAALAVNNAAAALVLALNTVARGAGVAVSRGELVEIGGGFRIPEILERSGARLVEVGATNRTRLRDYEAALTDSSVRAILKVHRSNFRITGFTEEVGLGPLATIAQRRGIPLLHDLGSGLMVEPARIGLSGEPTPGESISAGADLVTFSGDKLLGGPQAGILLGRADLVAAARANPLCRALRVDKVTLAGLEATLRLYRDPRRALAEIPTLRMLGARPAELESRARELASRMVSHGVSCAVVRADGAVGGGTFPGVVLESWAIEIGAPDVGALARALRQGEPPVIGHIRDDRLLLDLRTVLPGQDGVLVRRLRESLGT